MLKVGIVLCSKLPTSAASAWMTVCTGVLHFDKIAIDAMNDSPGSRSRIVSVVPDVLREPSITETVLVWLQDSTTTENV